MEELEGLLPAGLQECGRTFVLYLSSYPNLCVSARSSLKVLQVAQQSVLPRDIEAGRNAANTLFMIAQEADFLFVASVFYVQYERLCLKLLSWY